MARHRPHAQIGAVVLALAMLAACSSSSAHVATTDTATATTDTARASADSNAVSSSAPTGATVATTPPGTENTAPATGSGSPAADACSLLTPADIEAATGTAFGDPKAETPQQTQYGAYTACTWLEDESPLTTVQVTVWDQAKAFDDAKIQVGDGVDASGIGSRSFTSTLAAVYAVADGHTLFVQYSDFDNDDETNLPISEALAKVAAGNL
jgi:hypothetical protein